MILQPYVFDKRNKSISVNRFKDNSTIHFFLISQFDSPFIVAVVHELFFDTKTTSKYLIVDKKTFPIKFKRIDESLFRFACLLGFNQFRFANLAFDSVNELEDYYYQFSLRVNKK